MSSLQNPLEIYMNLVDAHNRLEHHPGQIVRTLRLLISNLYRCRWLECADIPAEWDSVPFLDEMPDLGRLERLEIHACHAEFIQSTPLLRRFKLSYAEIWLERTDLWRNLRDLELDGWTGTESEVLEVLRLCSESLETISITSALPTVQQTDPTGTATHLPPQVVTLSKLSQASIILDLARCRSTRHIPDSVLLRIRAPRLAALYVPL